jgi:hypothetical protein
MMSYASGPSFAPVRCVCVASGNGHTKPNMHHKFVVLADRAPNPHHSPDSWSEPEIYVPHTVWIGSYNFTEGSNCSFENAVII